MQDCKTERLKDCMTVTLCPEIYFGGARAKDLRKSINIIFQERNYDYYFYETNFVVITELC